MVGLAFDTLAVARRLKEVGMEESHAEAIAESLRDAVTASVATKQDPAVVEARFREDLMAIKADLRAITADFRTIKWLTVSLIGMMLLMLGRMFAIL